MGPKSNKCASKHKIIIRVNETSTGRESPADKIILIKDESTIGQPSLEWVELRKRMTANHFSEYIF